MFLSSLLPSLPLSLPASLPSSLPLSHPPFPVRTSSHPSIQAEQLRGEGIAGRKHEVYYLMAVGYFRLDELPASRQNVETALEVRRDEIDHIHRRGGSFTLLLLALRHRCAATVAVGEVFCRIPIVG